MAKHHLSRRYGMLEGPGADLFDVPERAAEISEAVTG